MGDLVATIHQILEIMTGSAGALALAAIARRYLPRIVKFRTKSVRGHRLKTDHGTACVVVMIAIDDGTQGRKSLKDAQDDGWDEAS